MGNGNCIVNENTVPHSRNYNSDPNLQMKTNYRGEIKKT